MLGLHTEPIVWKSRAFPVITDTAGCLTVYSLFFPSIRIPFCLKVLVVLVNNWTSRLLMPKCGAIRAVLSQSKSLIGLPGKGLKGAVSAAYTFSALSTFSPFSSASNRNKMPRDATSILRPQWWKSRTERGDIWRMCPRLVTVASSLDCWKFDFLLRKIPCWQKCSLGCLLCVTEHNAQLLQ